MKTTRRSLFGWLVGAAVAVPSLPELMAEQPKTVVRHWLPKSMGSLTRPHGASATCEVIGGELTGITITNSGRGYSHVDSAAIRFT